MAPRIKSVVLSLGFAALFAGCGGASSISKEPEHGTANGKMEPMLAATPENPVHTIVMPHDESQFPAGPGHDEFVTACIVCNSPRDISSHPRFSRTTCFGDANKLKAAYGAHMSDDKTPRI